MDDCICKTPEHYKNLMDKEEKRFFEDSVRKMHVSLGANLLQGKGYIQLTGCRRDSAAKVKDHFKKLGYKARLKRERYDEYCTGFGLYVEVKR